MEVKNLTQQFHSLSVSAEEKLWFDAIAKCDLISQWTNRILPEKEKMSRSLVVDVKNLSPEAKVPRVIREHIRKVINEMIAEFHLVSLDWSLVKMPDYSLTKLYVTFFISKQSTEFHERFFNSSNFL